MFFPFFSKKRNAISPGKTPKFPARIHDEIDALIDALPVGPELYEAHIHPVVYRLLMSFDRMPASEKHHHTEPWGLLIHSLEVARFTCVQLRTVCFCNDFSLGGARFQVEDHWRVAAIIAALVHDAGKTLYDIETVPAFPIPLNPEYTPIVRCRWNPTREHKNHEVFSAFFLGRILTDETLDFLAQYDTQIFHDLVLAISGHPTRSSMREILLLADSQSVRSYLEENHIGTLNKESKTQEIKKHAGNVMPTSLIEERMKTTDLSVQDVIEELISQVRSGKGNFLEGEVSSASGNKLQTSVKALDKICSLNKSIQRPLLVGLISLRSDISLSETSIFVNAKD